MALNWAASSFSNSPHSGKLRLNFSPWSSSLHWTLPIMSILRPSVRQTITKCWSEPKWKGYRSLEFRLSSLEETSLNSHTTLLYWCIAYSSGKCPLTMFRFSRCPLSPHSLPLLSPHVSTLCCRVRASLNVTPLAFVSSFSLHCSPFHLYVMSHFFSPFNAFFSSFFDNPFLSLYINFLLASITLCCVHLFSLSLSLLVSFVIICNDSWKWVYNV